jgi:hypothetical protein
VTEEQCCVTSQPLVTLTLISITMLGQTKDQEVAVLNFVNRKNNFCALYCFICVDITYLQYNDKIGEMDLIHLA